MDLIDLHTHSSFSPDADDPVEAMCRRAAEMKISVFAVTDHCDMNAFHEEGYDRNIPASIAETDRFRAGETDLSTRILTGLELGQPLQNKDETERFLDGILPKTDFVIGSLHNLRDYPDFAFLDYEREDIPDLLKRYFTELNEMVRWGRFDSLGHLTYPLRYIAVGYGRPVDLTPFSDLIDDILRFQAEKGRAIEVNTSGLRQKIAETMPPLAIVKRFRELGGRYVTLGSDAHRVQDIGSGIREGTDLLLDAGFTETFWFRSHEPVPVSLER